MYLRRNRRRRGKWRYVYWTLVESIRTERGPRQRIVATIGKLSSVKKEERIGWEEIARVLDGKSVPDTDLFKEEDDIPQWAEVNTKGVKVERLREFGSVYLGIILWKRLKLDDIFEKLQEQGREEIRWADMFAVMTIARFCRPSSELAIAESWYEKTALEDLTGIANDKVNDDRLYRSLDEILPHKDEVCRYLQDRYTEWFGSKFDFLFYDVTSTYFEGECPYNEQAKRGYSRDKRSDCKQVCIGLVVNLEGLPVGYEVFDGNRKDVTTLEEMIELMETKYGKAQRVWVFDRGVVSEENLGYLRQRGAHYVVGTLRDELKQFEKELCEKNWDEVECGVEVRIVRHPEHGEEKFVLCRSRERGEKERAMIKRQMDRLEKELQKIKAGIDNGRLKKKEIGEIERRIGRWQGRYLKAAAMIETKLIKDANGQLTDIKMEKRMEKWGMGRKSVWMLFITHRLNRRRSKEIMANLYSVKSN